MACSSRRDYGCRIINSQQSLLLTSHIGPDMSWKLETSSHYVARAKAAMESDGSYFLSVDNLVSEIAECLHNPVDDKCIWRADWTRVTLLVDAEDDLLEYEVRQLSDILEQKGFRLVEHKSNLVVLDVICE